MIDDEGWAELIDATVRKHPCLRDSRTIECQGPAGKIMMATFVVPETELTVQAGYRADPVEDWRLVWEMIYRTADAPQRADLDLRGWQSSYRRQPMPEDEMRQWVDNAVSSISATGARTFCEIGCGSGLLTFRLAPSAQYYLGIDMAETAIELVSQEIGRRNLESHIELRSGAASEVATIAGAKRFDCVIFNSVAQYFPDEEYLTNTMVAAASVVAPGGFIFVGDVRHLGIADAFYASILHEPGMSDELLKLQVRMRAEEEGELLVDPGYFTKLRAIEPSITGVQISLKPSGPDNELTRFRYDVLLQINGPAPSEASIAELDWYPDVRSVDRLCKVLNGTDSEFAVDAIPNARIAAYFALLDSGAGPRQSPGITVEEISAAAAAYGWRAHFDWSPESQEAGSMRVLFHRRDFGAHGMATIADSCPPVKEPVVNNPRRAAFLRSLPRAIRLWTRERLPDPTIPGIIRVIPSMPLTSSGSVDHDTLGAIAQITARRIR